MPPNEDPMPLNGNLHPLHGEFVSDNIPWVVPPYPAIGWNDVPAPAPEEPQDDHIDPPGWGNDVWGEAEKHNNEEQPVQPGTPEQDQLSMVLDHPEPYDSVEQPVQVIQIQDDEPLLQQPQVEDPMLALVPYQPLPL